MSATLLQLHAKGNQDVFLTSNPQITFYKQVFRRHADFACEAIEQTITGNPDFGNKVTINVSRNGDLIGDTYLTMELPALRTLKWNNGTAAVKDNAGKITAAAEPGSLAYDPTGDVQPFWCNNIGNKIISMATLEIGGQRIDQLYGEWMGIWSELTLTEEKLSGYRMMVGNEHDEAMMDRSKEMQQLYIPINFFFTQSPGLALPLIALQYHEVKIHIEFSKLAECIVIPQPSGNEDELYGFYDACGTFSLNQMAKSGNNSGTRPEMEKVALWIDYYYLGNDERTRFAQHSHEYLITQVQRQEESFSVAGGNHSSKIRLNFNHPVKELIWVAQNDDNIQNNGETNMGKNQWFNFGADTLNSMSSENMVIHKNKDLITSASLKLNGHDRYAVRPSSYFRLVQPFQHHTRCPDSFIYAYSFALRPEEHQPSGSLNFSRIDNAQLTLQHNNVHANGKIRIYAVNYNVLRILGGMGGMAFSN